MVRPLASLLTGALAFSTSAAAQYASPPAPEAVAAAGGALRPGATTLKGAYRVRLRSMWPQHSEPSSRCTNGGEEALDGVVSRGADGSYRGELHRRTRMLFCGAHGGSTEACELVLLGDGQVEAEGVVVPDDRNPAGWALWMRWTPAPSHGAGITGACPRSFKNAVERMYLTAIHGVEFPLPAAGAAPRRERLEDYPWTVELE